MNSFQIDLSIWDNIINQQKIHPPHFESYEDKFDIKKLDLAELTVKEIRTKILDWKQKKNSPARGTFKTWLENEYRVFMWLIVSLIDLGHDPDFYENKQWEEIGQLILKEGKVCKYFYLCSKKQLYHVWTDEEDKIVIEAMKVQDGSKKWTEIGINLFDFSKETKVHKPKAIRQRWFSRLNPAIKKSTWSTEQDLKLFQFIKNYGKKWSKIAKEFGNRNQHTIKNRYHQLILRKLSKLKQQKIEVTQDELFKIKNEELLNIKQREEKQAMLSVDPISALKYQNSDFSHFSQKTQGKVLEGEGFSEYKPHLFVPIVLKQGNFEI